MVVAARFSLVARIAARIERRRDARENRAYYVDMYRAKLAEDPDYLVFGGGNKIAYGLRMLITECPGSYRFNRTAVQTIHAAAIDFDPNLTARLLDRLARLV